MATGFSPFGLVKRALPSPRTATGTEAQARYDPYGGQHVQVGLPFKQALMDEGCYFATTNPTPATALATGVNASFDVTKGLFVLYNGATATEGTRVFPDYLKIIPTVAPASGTSFHYAVYLDSTNRYTSGGTAMTSKNANMDSSTSPSATLYAASGGTVITVATASSNARLVGRTVLRGAIPVINDELILQFGGTELSGATPVSTIGRVVCNAPPVAIPPGGSMVVIFWSPSNAVTGLSYEFEMGHWER